MALVMDPQEYEVNALERVMDWRGKRVLEVGCGDGRLTLRLARLGAKKIDAFDPDAGLIKTARRNLSARYKKQIEYRVGHAEHLDHPAETFDVVVLSWAL